MASMSISGFSDLDDETAVVYVNVKDAVDSQLHPKQVGTQAEFGYTTFALH